MRYTSPCLFLWLFLWTSLANAASTTSSTTNTVAPTFPAATKLRDIDVKSTGWDSFDHVDHVDADSEAGRKFRRTVYSHDDWKQHRSPDRLFYYIRAMFQRGVYQNLLPQVLWHVGLAAFICLWNGLLVHGMVNFQGVRQAPLSWGAGTWPQLALPMAPINLAASSLGLLLVFRTNTSYGRWDEARKNWGSNINRTRDLVRMANAFYNEKEVKGSTTTNAQQRHDDLHQVALCTWMFVRSMKRHLSPEQDDEGPFQEEIQQKLTMASRPTASQHLTALLQAQHRPNRALQDLSYAIEQLPLHMWRKTQLHQALTQFEDNLGACERLLTSPVPVFYSRHLARFLSIWFFLLPFGLYDTFAQCSWNGIGLLPAMGLLTVLLFGIEELATQLEEPFTILPMQAFCDKIYNWVMEIASFQPLSAPTTAPQSSKTAKGGEPTAVPLQ
mmetsp:Transcript_37708/g.78253  ORF Transcript_37708/g.78253 Transcript_37708/m.78253 type:complete len:442 (+) Transcript_37708:65-1390(+)